MLFSASMSCFSARALHPNKANPPGKSDGTEIFAKKLGSTLRGIPFFQKIQSNDVIQ